MILPTKHVRTAHSLLGLGGQLLGYLREDRTVTSLWNEVRELPTVGTFSRFVLALDLLFLMDAVYYEGGLLRRRR